VAAAKLQARANGKMRKEDEESPERIRVENVENIVTRTKVSCDQNSKAKLIEP
jgi:hypothetical protein